MSLIDFDDSAPTSSETTNGVNDLSGLFSCAAQHVQANIIMHAQAPVQYQQQQQQQPPFTYAPTPLSYNNSSNMGMIGGMSAFIQPTPNAMSPLASLNSLVNPYSLRSRMVMGSRPFECKIIWYPKKKNGRLCDITGNLQSIRALLHISTDAMGGITRPEKKQGFRFR